MNDSLPRDSSEPPPAAPADGWGDLVATSLRQPEALREAIRQDSATWRRLLLLTVPSMAAVGLLIALFSGGAQLLAVPAKVVLGTLAAMAICLPSLFVFSNLSGSAIDLRQALGSMAAAVAVLSLVLLALAPIALVFSLSTNSVVVVGTIHVLFLLFAGWFGGGALGRLWESKGDGFSPASAWMLLFLVVLLQLSTTLRPLVGPYAPTDLDDKKIFIEHWFGRDAPTESE